jgi:hypothetical protein
MDDDFLLFDDDPDEASGPPSNVLAVRLPDATSDALTLRAAAMRRDPDWRDGCRVLFQEDEADKFSFSNAKEFQTAMRWPRLPTLEEAGAWLLQKRDAVDARTAAQVGAAGDG